MEGKREYLNGTIRLSSAREGGEYSEYQIHSVIGEGASSVCYEATRTLKNGMQERGKLKEFYPVDSLQGSRQWYFSLERQPDGQLYAKSGTLRKFEEMCCEYIDTYKMLNHVMVENPQNEILKNYIQHGEILYGTGPNGKENPAGRMLKKLGLTSSSLGPAVYPTVYVWSAGVPGTGFDRYLEEVRRQPDIDSEKRLKDILHVFHELTDCVKALHTAGLLHMDIKPSNFLVQFDSDHRIKADHISLFDINTLTSIDNPYALLKGTFGYSAPEIRRGRADNRSDLYSLGAMLFHSLVIHKRIPDGLYQDTYYENLPILLKESALFNGSDVNSDPYLMSGLLQILRKTLAPRPQNRYAGSSQLKSDLRKVIARLDTLLLSPSASSQNGQSDPQTAMQKLLYDHPLYEAGSSNNALHVLVLGSGSYGQKFIDTTLQAGQMDSIRLVITAVSDHPKEDAETYLQFRPGLCEFVQINGRWNDQEMQPYAELNFVSLSDACGSQDETLHFTSTASRHNERIIGDLIQNAAEKQMPFDYALTALGSDSLNENTAIQMAGLINPAVPVCYIREEKTEAGQSVKKERPYAVETAIPYGMESIDSGLLEMAMNTHLSWNAGSMLNVDMQQQRNQFFKSQKPADVYNRHSSIAFALSIPYKLHSIGIDAADPLTAAKLFSERVLKNSDDSKTRKILGRLSALEHRRWVLEKVCQGWSAPWDALGHLDLQSCLERCSVKDPVKLTHPCLVFSTENLLLSSPAWQENGRQKWDAEEIDEEIDALDAMSLQLHRLFKKRASLLQQEGLWHNPDLQKLASWIPEGNQEVRQAYDQFVFLLQSCLEQNEGSARQFPSACHALKQALSTLEDPFQHARLERLEMIERTYFPVIESCLYRDYKKYDLVLVEKIPFILTFRYTPSMAAVFRPGKCRTETFLSSTAAASVLCPQKFVLFVPVTSRSDAVTAVHHLESILKYFGSRNGTCQIDLSVFCTPETDEQTKDQLDRALCGLEMQYPSGQAKAFLKRTAVHTAENARQMLKLIEQKLKQSPVDLFCMDTPPSDDPFENAVFLKMLRHNRIPSFSFNRQAGAFYDLNGCQSLAYLKDQSCLQISDLLLLNQDDNIKKYVPEFQPEAAVLWKICTSANENISRSISAWIELCRQLKKTELDRKPIAVIPEADPFMPKKEMVFTLPSFARQTLSWILEQLNREEAGLQAEQLYAYGNDSLRLHLQAGVHQEKALRKLFAENAGFFLPYYHLQVCQDAQNHAVCIRTASLQADHIRLDPDLKKQTDIQLRILQLLEKENWIEDLVQDSENGNIVSFRYASPDIQEFLMDPVRILELYVWTEIQKAGVFDDFCCIRKTDLKSAGQPSVLIGSQGFTCMKLVLSAIPPLKKMEDSTEELSRFEIRLQPLTGDGSADLDLVLHALPAALKKMVSVDPACIQALQDSDML